MRQIQRRELLKATGAAGVVGGLAGCVEGDGQGRHGGVEAAQQDGRQPGAVRVVHASPDAPNVDIYLHDELVVTDLGFRELTPYQELDPGTSQILVTAAGDRETVLFEEGIGIQEGVSNTAVAYGETAGDADTGFTVDVLEDDLSDPGEGMSRVRLFHASPDAPELTGVGTELAERGDLADGNWSQTVPQDNPDSEQSQQETVLFESVGFGESASQTIPGDEYSLGVYPAEDVGQHSENETNRSLQSRQQPAGDQSAQQPIAAYDLTAESRTVYSAFATGYISPEEAPVDEAFEIIAVVDAAAGSRASGGTESGNGTE